MDRETITIPFKEWVKFIFRHGGWEWDGDSWDEPSPSELIAYITRLFENAGEAMTSYSDNQVAEGLRDLSYVEENIIILLDESVSLLDQIRCIQSMYALFEQVFVPRCSPLLFHLGEGEANSLNDACYMWWDTLPIFAHPVDPARAELDREFLSVIEQTLYLDSDVCRESALHGLGRWHYDYAKEVEAIIDGFLSRKPELRPELKFFALEARRGKDETFETWIKYFFDHPVPTNLSAIDVNYWGQWFPPTISVAYITRAFENASELLAPYSDAQLNQGLWHLAHEDIPDLWSDELPWADQKQGVEAIFTLFEQFFAVRCSSALSHTMRSKEDAAQANPLNSICYMWWDIFPTWGHPNEPDDKQFDAALLDVMERSLYIDSDACREGALHGLGHWHGRYGEKVTRIIEKFIARVPELPPDLKVYALNAKYGSVL